MNALERSLGKIDEEWPSDTMEVRPQRSSTPSQPDVQKACRSNRPGNAKVLLPCGGGEPMKVTIQLDSEVYEHIRMLVHDELNEQESRQRFKQLAMKIRTQLDQLRGSDGAESGLEADLDSVLHN